jgi:hypothetical protein
MTSTSTQPLMTGPSLLVDETTYTSPGILRDHSTYLQHPPTAYHKQSRHPSPRVPPLSYIPSPKQHGSVSSGRTASSTASTSKLNCSHSTSPYYMSPHAEQGHMSPSKPDQRRRPVGSATPQSMSDTERRTRDDNSAVFTYIQEQEAQERESDHAISVLVFLSALDPFYSALTALYSILVGLVLLLALPLQICNKSFSAGDSIVRLLAPLLRKHLQFLHADSVEDLHDFNFNPLILVLVHTISPLLSVGVAISAWVAAGFWLFALMMGNPDGTERGDDGRATVLNLRNWWEKFLLSSANRP